MIYKRLLIGAAGCFSGRLSLTTTACCPTTLRLQINQVASRLICGVPAGINKGLKRLELSENIIVSSSFREDDLKVWDTVSGRCLRKLRVKNSGWFEVSGKRVVTISDDGTMQLWNTDTGENTRNLTGHTGWITRLLLHDNKIISSSKDGTIRVWNADSGECLQTFRGHTEVHSIHYDGQLVLGASYGNLVKVWNPESEECFFTMESTKSLKSLQLDNTYVVATFDNGGIQVWDKKAGVCLHTLVGHNQFIKDFVWRNNTLVSRCSHGIIKVFDMISGQCIITPVKERTFGVPKITIYENLVILLDEHRRIALKVWDVKTGEFRRHESGLPETFLIYDMQLHSGNLKFVCGTWGLEEEKVLVVDFDIRQRKVVN